jgi:hypothetical protein
VKFSRTTHWLRGAVAGVVCAIGHSGLASAEPVDELDRWVPALGIFSGVIGQNSGADISTGIQVGTTVPLRPPADDRDILWSPFVGGDLELMTPGWHALPGSPRLFVRGGLDATFGFNRDIAKEGSPDDLEFPALGPADPPFNLQERQVPGQGSSLSARVTSPAIRAGGGLALTFELGERRVRLKTSVEYLRTEIDLDGKARDATRFLPGGPGPPVMPTVFRFVTIDEQSEFTVDGLGGGLELEADAGRAGPMLLSLYVGGQAYRVLGDTKTSFTGSFTDVFSTETAQFDFEVDPWHYRAGVGLRFRFVPEDGEWWPFR